jgi:hypothetical protein
MNEKPNTLKIDDTTYVREDSIPIPYTSRKEGPWEIGKRYFIRTVTMHLHGRLIDVTQQELVLTEAAWIADSGRFSNFIRRLSKPNEVEPFDPAQIVIVGRGALIDATTLDDSFKEQK